MQIRAVAIVSLQCNECIQNVCERERERESDRANFGAVKCIQTRGLEACAPLIKTEPTRFICPERKGGLREAFGDDNVEIARDFASGDTLPCEEGAADAELAPK
mmetsp:Transcript_98823/g.159320  ORF Transcript_98823/g.159320 Transcript_98823/m.159320 type:complete len:104 (+) Transcript_98823:1095-1406(+)